MPPLLANVHARFIAAKFDTEGIRPQFARNAVTNRVHVVAPADTQPAYTDRTEAAFDFALGRRLMVCGTIVAFNKGGLEKGGHPVYSFDDDDLCQRCWKAFGEQAWILFDANRQPDTDTDTDTLLDTEGTTTMIEYLVTSERIGRTDNISWRVFADNPAQLSSQITALVRPLLRSAIFEVLLDMNEGTGVIMCGAHVGGRFTFADLADLTALDTFDTRADEAETVANGTGVASP